MKLLKKLLPIASVAGVAAIVTPLVTSCGTSGSFTQTRTGKEMKADKYYEAKVDQAEGKNYTDAKVAQKDYFDAVKENKKILVDDMLWDVFGDWSEPLNLLNASSDDNKTVIHESVSISKFDAEKGIISGKISQSMKTTQYRDDDEDYKMTGTEKTNVSFKNLPFYLWYGTSITGKEGFILSMDEEQLQKNDDWEIIMATSLKEVIKTKDGTEEMSEKSKETYNKDSWKVSNPAFMTSFYSHYFGKCTLA